EQADDDGSDGEQSEDPDRQGPPRHLFLMPTSARWDDHRLVAVHSVVELAEAGLERADEGVHRREPPLRVLFERVVDRGRDAQRNVPAYVKQVRRRFVYMLHRDGHEALPREGHVAGQELVEDGAERIDVAVRVDALASRLL